MATKDRQKRARSSSRRRLGRRAIGLTILVLGAPACMLRRPAGPPDPPSAAPVDGLVNEPAPSGELAPLPEVEPYAAEERDRARDADPAAGAGREPDSVAPIEPPPSAGRDAPRPAERSAPDSEPRRYAQLADVTLAPDVERKIAAIAEAYHRRTGKRLVLTSGTRDVGRQAEAVYEVMRLGGDITKVYRNKEAAKEIATAFQAGRAAQKAPRAIVDDLVAVLRAQIARGVYVSAHLRAGAVDVRSRGMSKDEKRALIEGVAEVGGAEVIEEMTPPHFHIQLEE